MNDSLKTPKKRIINGVWIFILAAVSCQDAPVDEPSIVELQPPSGFTLRIVNAESIDISWLDNSIGELGYLLERKDSSEYSEVALLTENATSYQDSSAVYGEYNHYRLSILDAEVDSLIVQDSIAFVYLDTDWSTVPAGEYRYGLSGDLRNDLNTDFDMMTYEVTNAQFVAFLNEAMELGSITVPGSLPIGIYEGDEHWPAADRMAADVNDPDSRMTWTGVEFVADAGAEDNPVSEVPWFGAYFFARHYGLSLPTEHEWEKAARGTNDDPYPWGSTPLNCDLANTAGCGARLIDVGVTQGVSPFGVHDLIGNVWEWVDDFIDTENPGRVLRGGSCNSTTTTTHVYDRRFDDAWHTSYFYGFRCIKK